MIQLALRSSIQAEPPFGAPRSSRIEGSATAVTMSSSPARNTPTPMTASSTAAERRVMPGSVVVTAGPAGARHGSRAGLRRSAPADGPA